MPTKEELAKVIPPLDVREQINKASEYSGMAKDKIKNAFKKALALNSLDVFTNMDDRCREAMSILISKIKAQMPSDSTPMFPMEFTIFALSAPKTITTKNEKVDPITKNKVVVPEEKQVANAYGIFAGAPTDDPEAPQLPPKLGILTTWSDACQVIAQMNEGGAYRGRFVVKQFDDHYELTLNSYEKMEEMENTLPPAKDIIQKFYTPFPVSQIAYHIGDRQLMRGRIIRNFTKLARTGKNMGYTVVTDSGVDASILAAPKMGEKREQSIMWNAPEFAMKYPVGTDCFFMISVNNKSEQYGISAFGDFIIPITIEDPAAASIFDDDPFDYDVEAIATPAPANNTWAQPASKPVENTNVPSPAAQGEW